MKIKFKSQPYQAQAVDAVVDCFDGQPRQDALRYTIDPGAGAQTQMEIAGFGNAELLQSSVSAVLVTRQTVRLQLKNGQIIGKDGLV